MRKHQRGDSLAGIPITEASRFNKPAVPTPQEN